TLSNSTHNFTAATDTGGSTSPSSGFPDASTTGVPAGKTLTSVNGNFTTTSAGQVIDGLNVHGTIIVDDPGVIIRNCQAEFIIITASNVTIEDSDVVGNNLGGTAIWMNTLGTGPNYGSVSNVTIQRCDISGAENGIWLDGNGCLIKDNYIHGLRADANPDP